MITATQLETYIKVDGNPDTYQRLSDSLKIIDRIEDREWAVLDDLILRLSIRKSGQESVEYSKKTSNLISRELADDDVLKNLNRYASGEKYKTIYSASSNSWRKT